ncbi:hypothetical protein [Legionella longbeachae]|uniref:Uncharacterized protein n=1 Tax=Legionella longbeachae serogroup 1 (strain NSW150) TaxID=661367 RepID=D3HK64_LEGLN|nr:hypothetical protein [Legionella longbeachae]VEE03345.1 Uncharacterised protein [Legionella oakridgensis]ARB93758.1 hypothetical protein A6J40_16955 [Legionella longbeachae]ARM33102.1 hypothetical protein B0B39_06000 [Legionella longbeachae]EEZ94061.1 hypothetical protein LLB_2960 [Legionella longbeachae D-4968]QIN33061.1 hypothetical protein GCB94_13360 [Legionella longbeachae]
MESKFVECTKQFDQELQLPKRQLIILINPNKNGDMGNRLKLFLEHAVARGGDARISALALVQGTDKIEAIDVKTQAILIFKEKQDNVFEPFVNKIVKNKATLIFKGEDKKVFDPFVNKIKEFNLADSNSFDSILIIGAGVPNTKRSAYKSINGITEVQRLIEPLERIISSYLKDNGLVRVQICHANTCKVSDQAPTFQDSTFQDSTFQDSTFAQKITAAAINKKNATLSAPDSFSIISTNDARVFDVFAETNAFMKMRGPCKKILNKKHDDSEIQSKFMLYLNLAEKSDKTMFNQALHCVKLVNHNINIPFKEEDIKKALAEKEFLTCSKITDRIEEKKMGIDKSSYFSSYYSAQFNQSTKVGNSYDPSFFSNKEIGMTTEEKTHEISEKIAHEDASNKITPQEDTSNLDNFFLCDFIDRFYCFSEGRKAPSAGNIGNYMSR